VVHDELTCDATKDCSAELHNYLSDKIWKDDIVNEIQNPSKNGKDDGEYACINLCLTIEMHEEIDDEYQLLVDDRGARKIAIAEDISCIGSIGVMRKAIRKGHWSCYDEITSAIITLEKAVNETSFRLPIEKLKEELTKAMQLKNIIKTTVQEELEEKTYYRGM
jgi:predicted nucleic acid-binding protein